MQKSIQIARVLVLSLAVFFCSGFIHTASASTILSPKVVTKNPLSKAAIQINKVSYTSSIEKMVTSKVFLTSVKVTEVKEKKVAVQPVTVFAAAQPVSVPQISPQSEPSGAGLSADVLFTMINEHRAKIGLPAYIKNDELCSIAASRGPELYGEIFVTYSMHAGLYKRNLPYWITENMIHQKTEALAMQWWLNSPVHRAAIEGNYTYSCGTCVGYSCEQLFTSFQSKYPQATTTTPALSTPTPQAI